MPRTLVIAYGNPLRGDDGFGCQVAERLFAVPEIAADSSIKVELAHQLLPELAEAVAGAELVIFVDAAAPSAGWPPGSLRCEAIYPQSDAPDALGHFFTPARLLTYASAIYDGNPRALVMSVTASSFELGESLTPAVEAAIPEMVRHVLDAISNRGICARSW